jgi:hypothetical protein
LYHLIKLLSFAVSFSSNISLSTQILILFSKNLLFILDKENFLPSIFLTIFISFSSETCIFHAIFQSNHSSENLYLSINNFSKYSQNTHASSLDKSVNDSIKASSLLKSNSINSDISNFSQLFISFKSHHVSVHSLIAQFSLVIIQFSLESSSIFLLDNIKHSLILFKSN